MRASASTQPRPSCHRHSRGTVVRSDPLTPSHQQRPVIVTERSRRPLSHRRRHQSRLDSRLRTAILGPSRLRVHVLVPGAAPAPAPASVPCPAATPAQARLRSAGRLLRLVVPRPAGGGASGRLVAAVVPQPAARGAAGRLLVRRPAEPGLGRARAVAHVLSIAAGPAGQTRLTVPASLRHRPPVCQTGLGRVAGLGRVVPQLGGGAVRWVVGVRRRGVSLGRW